MPAFMLLMFLSGLWCAKRTTDGANRVARAAANAAREEQEKALDLAKDLSSDGNNVGG